MANEGAPSVHFIIVNWNTGIYLRQCMDALAAQQLDGYSVERVTVIDNASTDGSADALDAGGLPLRVIVNDENVGFGAACNQAAVGSDARYLLFLNPDTAVSADAVGRVTRFMESELATDVGICGAHVVDAEGNPNIGAARFPTLRNFTGKITGLDRVLPRLFPSHHLTASELESSRYVDQVIGAFFFVRRPLFRQLNGFDEQFFLYFEEVDFAKRAALCGWRSFVLRDAAVVHFENISASKAPVHSLHHSLRSRRLYAARYWPRWQACVLLVLTVAAELPARLVREILRGGWSGATNVLRSYARFLSNR